jgi:hypothetical protein
MQGLSITPHDHPVDYESPMPSLSPRYTFSPQILGGLRGNAYLCGRNIGLFGELHSGLDAYSQ